MSSFFVRKSTFRQNPLMSHFVSESFLWIKFVICEMEIISCLENWFFAFDFSSDIKFFKFQYCSPNIFEIFVEISSLSESVIKPRYKLQIIHFNYIKPTYYLENWRKRNSALIYWNESDDVIKPCHPYLQKQRRFVNIINFWCHFFKVRSDLLIITRLQIRLLFWIEKEHSCEFNLVFRQCRDIVHCLQEIENKDQTRAHFLLSSVFWLPHFLVLLIFTFGLQRNRPRS